MTFRTGRLACTVALTCVTILAAGARARADVFEYCPVELAGPTQVVAPNELGLEFQSDGPRTVSGSLFVLGTDGWYQADFTSVPLAQADVTVSEPGVQYTRHPYRSQPVYVTVPDAFGALAAFVVQAQATGDPNYGWDARGMVACDPPPDPRPVATAMATRFASGEPALSPVQPASTVLHAQSIAAPSGFSLQCADPFAAVQQTSKANAEFDAGSLGVRGDFVAFIRVAVNEHGKVDSAWPWVSSGYPEYDKAMVLQAERSYYTAARSFCTPVRGYYTIRIRWHERL